MNNLQNAVRRAGTKIEHLNALVLRGVLDRLYMAVRKIHHMDVIAAAGAVRCRVIVTENREMIASANGNLRDIRHQIVRNPLRVLADTTGLMCADRIEIAQKNDSQFRVSLCRVLKNFFHHDLGPAIWVGAAAALHRFDVRNRILLAVYRRGGRENKLLDTCLLHALEQRQRGVNVVAVILQRLLYRLTDCLQTSKVNHAVDLVFCENPLYLGSILHVSLVGENLLSGDFFNSVDNFRTAVAVIVCDYYVMSAH